MESWKKYPRCNTPALYFNKEKQGMSTKCFNIKKRSCQDVREALLEIMSIDKALKMFVTFVRMWTSLSLLCSLLYVDIIEWHVAFGHRMSFMCKRMKLYRINVYACDKLIETNEWVSKEMFASQVNAFFFMPAK